MGEIWGEIPSPALARWSLPPEVGEALSHFTLRLEVSTGDREADGRSGLG